MNLETSTKLVLLSILTVLTPLNDVIAQNTTKLSQNPTSRYTRLESLLKAQNFKGADTETSKVMLALANRQKEGFLTAEDVEKFPCRELRIIDKLWLKYSRGKFGISVQQKIYESLGGREGIVSSELDWSFANRVGWVSRTGAWIGYDRLNFSQKAPSGHLPRRIFFSDRMRTYQTIFITDNFPSLLFRCNT
jgi:hypothetical protein